jgi:hypothetical protein
MKILSIFKSWSFEVFEWLEENQYEYDDHMDYIPSEVQF